MTWPRRASLMLSYQSQNPPSPSGSSRPSVNRARNVAVVEQRRDQAQGGFGVPHQRQAGDPQGVVHAGSPVPLRRSSRRCRRGCPRPGGGRRVVERVEAGRVGLVGVDEDDPVGVGGGQPVEDVGDQVAARVDDHGAAAGFDVAEDHVEQQGGFADAGLADHVHVLAGVGHVQADAVPADLRPARAP